MKSRFLVVLGAAALWMTLSGCAKKAPPPPPPPAPSARPEPAAAAPAATPRPATARPSQPAPAAPVSRMPDAATRARIQELLDRIQDAYFDYNKHDLRPDAEAALQKDAQTLTEIISQYPDFKLTVEGHCDERGSDEYNLALGDSRAMQAKAYLGNLGLPANQLRTISFGKEHPVCTDHDETCWQKNRRAHITQE
jgi:peptidoglycan-associated lipoprotein